jgi:hypothetical protein
MAAKDVRSSGPEEHTLKERYKTAIEEQNQRTRYERYRCNRNKYQIARRAELEDHLQVE